MSYARFNREPSRFGAAPAMALPSRVLAGVRTRRMLAAMFDLAIVTVLAVGIAVFFAVPTLGLTLFFFPTLYPMIAFFYNGMTVSGRNMGTWGMQWMDLEMGLMDGQPVPFLNAAAHAVLFYLSLSFPPIFLISLLSSDKRCLHDMLTDVIVTRRTV